MRKNTRVRSKSQSLGDLFLQAVNHCGRLIVQLRVLGPVYVTSVGLAYAYSSGWGATYAGVFGVALGCVTWTCELLKPVIGEKLEENRHRPWRARALTLVAVFCVAFCGLSGVIAYSAAEAPQVAYERGQAAIAAAEGEVREVREALTHFSCTTDMPASRCTTFRSENGDAESRAKGDLAGAQAALTAARSAAPTAPEISVPRVHWAVKLLLSLGIDFVLFVTPWAARVERMAEAPAIVVVPVAKAAPVQPVSLDQPVTLKVNDGGWAVRRERYGASGLKRKGKVVKIRAANA